MWLAHPSPPPLPPRCPLRCHRCCRCLHKRHTDVANATFPLMLLHCRHASLRTATATKVAHPPSCNLHRQAGPCRCCAATTKLTMSMPPPRCHRHQHSAIAKLPLLPAKLAAAPALPQHFLVDFAPAIAVAASVFITTAAAHGGSMAVARGYSMAVAAAGAAMPASVALPTCCLLPPPAAAARWQHCPRPPRFPLQFCRQ